MRWLWKNKFHFLVWGIFILYALNASDLYTALFLKQGKPLPGPVKLPAETGEIHLEVEDFRPAVVDGEDVYILSGWVFAPGMAESGSYTKKLVLHSTSEELIFPAATVLRRDLTAVFPQYGLNLDEAGFKVIISKHALEIDNYRMGIILEDTQGGLKVFRMLDQFLQREPNRMRHVGS